MVPLPACSAVSVVPPLPDWTGQTCVIVASGPSAAGVPLEKAKGRARFIAINNSWVLAPWADLVYGADYKWWKSVNSLPEFGGLKMAGEKRASEEFEFVKYLQVSRDDRLDLSADLKVGSGSNSGFQMLNAAAVKFHCKKIILVGFDMRLDKGLHWHGAHPKGMNNPSERNIGRMRRAVDGAAKVLTGLGVTVINTSGESALQNYPKMDFMDALEWA